MGLSYIELLDGIKMSLFSGDHSGLYMLVCAVACICASFSLISWYNKMLNEPYGQLDISAVIKTVTVLILICNFYSLVLIPFDFMTSIMTKGLTAYVDNDDSGMIGKFASLLESAEAEYESNTLSGEFQSSVAAETSDIADDSGFSYGSNAVMESKAETEVSALVKKGFWATCWDAIKMAGTFALGAPIERLSSILSWTISIIVKLVQYILLAVSSIYLIILGLAGPFVFALSLLPGFGNNISAWIARYIQISFWVPMSALVDFVNFKMKDALIAYFWTSVDVGKFAAPIHLIVLDVITLICLLAVPSLCSWVISSAGASDVNRAIAGTVAKVVMMKK